MRGGGWVVCCLVIVSLSEVANTVRSLAIRFRLGLIL